MWPLERPLTSRLSPLFVTWNKYADDDHSHSPSLRGCIGCFSAMPLEDGLREYALTR